MFKKVVILLILVPAYFSAQENMPVNKLQDNTFNMLFVAGLTPSQVHGDAYSGFNKLGLMGGVGVESQFSENWAANLSFLFIQKGARKNQNLQKNDLTYYYLNLNYVEVPVLFTYNQKRFLFDVGVSAAYLINYYEASDAGNFTGMYSFNKFDYSVKIGLGLNISPTWFVNFRSSNSFITTRPNRIKQSIYYNNILARTFNKGYYNNILEFAVGYRLKPGKKKID